MSIRVVRSNALELLLLWGFITGCTSLDAPSARILPSTNPEGLESAMMVYRVEHDVPNSDMGQDDSIPSVSSAIRLVQILTIKYPHPDGRAGYALSEVVVARSDTDGSTRSAGWLSRLSALASDSLPGVALGDGIQDAKAMDIPTSQLDHLLERLNNYHFFDALENLPGDGEVRLAISVNGQRHAKRWHHDSDLDELARKVRAEGKLVSHRASARAVFAPTKTLRRY